jgi:hypothetical protein
MISLPLHFPTQEELNAAEVAGGKPLQRKLITDYNDRLDRYIVTITLIYHWSIGGIVLFVLFALGAIIVMGANGSNSMFLAPTLLGVFTIGTFCICLIFAIQRGVKLKELPQVFSAMRSGTSSSVENLEDAAHNNSQASGKRVTHYVDRLEAALGNELAFQNVHAELCSDQHVQQAEAVEIAFRILTPIVTRDQALQHVLYRMKTPVTPG